MGNDTKSLLFTQSLLNRLFGHHKFRKRNFTFRLRLFLGLPYQTLDHFHLIFNRLSLREFWDKVFRLFKSLSNHRLDLIAADKMFNDTKALLFNHGLLDQLFN